MLSPKLRPSGKIVLRADTSHLSLQGYYLSSQAYLILEVFRGAQWCRAVELPQQVVDGFGPDRENHVAQQLDGEDDKEECHRAN